MDGHFSEIPPQKKRKSAPVVAILVEIAAHFQCFVILAPSRANPRPAELFPLLFPTRPPHTEPGTAKQRSAWGSVRAREKRLRPGVPTWALRLIRSNWPHEPHLFGCPHKSLYWVSPSDETKSPAVGASLASPDGGAKRSGAFGAQFFRLRLKTLRG